LFRQDGFHEAALLAAQQVGRLCVSLAKCLNDALAGSTRLNKSVAEELFERNPIKELL